MAQISRRFIKPLIPPIIYGIPKFFTYLIKGKNKYSGTFFDEEGASLDQKLEKYLNYSDGYFIELGANNGVDQSNTLYFEKYKNWRGTLIEPSPENFLRCLDNRSIKTKIFCNACVSFEYQERFVEIAFGNLMSSPVGLESDLIDPVSHAKNGNRATLIPVYGAVARTLNDILVEAGAPIEIDLLSLDVEGAEIEVLKGVDHLHFKFKYICVECRDIEKMKKYLESLGYKLIDKLSIHDYLFSKS
jgi:FkbM family methyltransferase